LQHLWITNDCIQSFRYDNFFFCYCEVANTCNYILLKTFFIEHVHHFERPNFIINITSYMTSFLHADVNVEITTFIRTHFVLHSQVVCLTSNVFLISSLTSAFVSMLKYYFRFFPFFWLGDSDVESWAHGQFHMVPS